MLLAIVLYLAATEPKKVEHLLLRAGSTAECSIYTLSVIDIPVKNITAYAQPSWQTTPPPSLRKTSVCERQKSSLIFVSLWPYTQTVRVLHQQTEREVFKVQA